MKDKRYISDSARTSFDTEDRSITVLNNMLKIIKTWAIHVDREERDRVESLGIDDVNYDYDTERLVPLYIKPADIAAIMPNTIRFQGVDDVECTDVFLQNGKQHLAMSKIQDILNAWIGDKYSITELPKSKG